MGPLERHLLIPWVPQLCALTPDSGCVQIGHVEFHVRTHHTTPDTHLVKSASAEHSSKDKPQSYTASCSALGFGYPEKFHSAGFGCERKSYKADASAADFSFSGFSFPYLSRIGVRPKCPGLLAGFHRTDFNPPKAGTKCFHFPGTCHHNTLQMAIFSLPRALQGWLQPEADILVQPPNGNCYLIYNTDTFPGRIQTVFVPPVLISRQKFAVQSVSMEPPASEVEKSSFAGAELVEDVDEGVSEEESVQLVGVLDFPLLYYQVETG